jgi:hypothetical protein
MKEITFVFCVFADAQKISYVYKTVGRVAQSVQRLRYGLRSLGINSSRGEIFRTRSVRSWGHPSLLYNGYRVSFPWVKRPGCGSDYTLIITVRTRNRPRVSVPGSRVTERFTGSFICFEPFILCMLCVSRVISWTLHFHYAEYS